jgi:hypothetical protein
MQAARARALTLLAAVAGGEGSADGGWAPVLRRSPGRGGARVHGGTRVVWSLVTRSLVHVFT